MKRRNKRALIVILVAAVLMIPADIFLGFLELPQPIRIVMMAVLGWMVGVEARKWIDK